MYNCLYIIYGSLDEPPVIICLSCLRPFFPHRLLLAVRCSSWSSAASFPIVLVILFILIAFMLAPELHCLVAWSPRNYARMLSGRWRCYHEGSVKIPSCNYAVLRDGSEFVTQCRCLPKILQAFGTRSKSSPQPRCMPTQKFATLPSRRDQNPFPQSRCPPNWGSRGALPWGTTRSSYDLDLRSSIPSSYAPPRSNSAGRFPSLQPTLHLAWSLKLDPRQLRPDATPCFARSRKLHPRRCTPPRFISEARSPHATHKRDLHFNPPQLPKDKSSAAALIPTQTPNHTRR